MFRTKTSLVCLFGILAAGSAHAEDSEGFRPYIAIRAVGALYSDSASVPGLELENPSQYPFPAFSLGANFSRYWGAEVAVNYVETHVKVPGVTERLGEYATWTILPQVRLRYPVFEDRLVPYIVGGVGLGVGEFNDRNALHGNIAFGGSSNTALIEAVGIGLDWFVERNIAINIEAKRTFGFETDVSFQGRNQTINSDSTLLSGGLRVFLGDPQRPDGAEVTRKPADSDALRGYVAFRTGVAAFPNGDDASALRIDSPTGAKFGGVAGANFNRHWGAEVSFDYWEPTLAAPAFGEVSEYALWTVLASFRYRYQALDARLVPYLLAGAGIGVAQVNDKRLRFETFPMADQTFTSVVGSIGAGIEYFLTYNVALGLEARYLLGFESDVKVGSQTVTLDNSTLLAMVGFRIFFP